MYDDTSVPLDFKPSGRLYVESMMTKGIKANGCTCAPGACSNAGLRASGSEGHSRPRTRCLPQWACVVPVTDFLTGLYVVGEAFQEGDIIGEYTGEWVTETKLLVDSRLMILADYHDEHAKTHSRQTKPKKSGQWKIERIAGEYTGSILESDVVYEGKIRKMGNAGEPNGQNEERYLVKWEGHIGKTWQSKKSLANTQALEDWENRTSKDMEIDSRPRGRYMIFSGTLDSRYCCKNCASSKSWNERIFIDAEYEGNWTRYINHSCNGNLEPVSVRYGPSADSRPVVVLRAKRPIQRGEELTFPYWQFDPPLNQHRKRPYANATRYIARDGEQHLRDKSCPV
ncbi:SET domain-containing protein [Peniophora sp. CONT]|nr:SET domain-containing protein [Peniophora sp. CONT]